MSNDKENFEKILKEVEIKEAELKKDKEIEAKSETPETEIEEKEIFTDQKTRPEEDYGDDGDDLSQDQILDSSIESVNEKESSIFDNILGGIFSL